MIKSWRHKGLKLFYETGNTSKIQARHAAKLHDVLQVLDFITKPEQMRLPGLEFHKLSGDLKGFYAIKVNANWRIVFGFDGTDVILVDYIDYH
jgi:proteic killer suppression protein